MQRTGEDSCNGSPYIDYSNQPTLANAKAELDFLISLLPKGERKEAQKASQQGQSDTTSDQTTA